MKRRKLKGIARCPGGTCNQQITCLHRRAVDTDPTVPEINYKKVKFSSRCPNYIRIHDGVRLFSWKTIIEARVGVQNDA